MNKKEFRGANLTLTTDDGYTITGRITNFNINYENVYDNVYSWKDLAISSALTDERYWIEAYFDAHEGYRIEQNFVEVVKNVVVKGDHSEKNAEFAYSVGVPEGAIFKTYYSLSKNETTFKWTERVMMSD